MASFLSKHVGGVFFLISVVLGANGEFWGTYTLFDRQELE